MATQREIALELAGETSVFTAAEAVQRGVHRHVLTRLVREGLIERVAPGRYRAADAFVTDRHGLVVATRAAPGGVICLLSALLVHEVGTRTPHQVWIALDRRTRRPTLAWPPLRVVRFGGAAYSEGIEHHELEGHPVPVYSLAKTLTDLFKYRNKVGLDVALEALGEAWRDQRTTLDDLDRYARICRVQNVVRPYLELLAV